MPIGHSPFFPGVRGHFLVQLCICSTMIDISQWRASIGGWNSTHCTNYTWCTYSPYSNKIPTGLGLTTLVVLCGCQVMMSLSLVLGLMRILMLSGDIELNPGPGNSPQLPDLFCLLRPHSAAWEDIGRALEVHKKYRDELFGLGIMKSNDSKLEDMLARWIESQCSEVSWDQLIEVLQEEQMVDTVGKIKKYLLNDPQAKEKYQWNDSSDDGRAQSCAIVHPSLPSFITRYSDLLKQKYSHQPVISSTKWPPRVGKDYYGRLILLDRKRRDVETEQHKIWNTMRGNIDVLPGVTQSEKVEISDVLKGDDSSAIVLIDGPPGVGKTTFCRKLLNLWAKGELPTDQPQRYTVVLNCSLRDKKIIGANTLTDIMKTCYDNRFTKMAAKYINENDGAGLLIIFDGWDELSMEHRESSLAVKFICREILLKCTVIVTSRSYASESIMRLNENCKHFEVIGFDKGQVYEVIKETLHDDGQLASDLSKELERETNIQSLCYIPLVCSMVILVYKGLKHLPSRLTELYKLFVLHAVKRHVDKSRTNLVDPKRIRLLKQIPDCIKPSFDKLCYFAYVSLKENNPKMTFSLPELQEALDVSSEEGYIGLMTTVSVYDEELYQFLHLTIQEFLAAWWIASNDGMDVKAFEEHFEDDHFRMCLRFVAGLTKLKNDKFMEMKYFNMQLDLRCAPKDMQPLSPFNFKSSCRQTSQLLSTDLPRQRILHLLYESSNTDLCRRIANTVIDKSFCSGRYCKYIDLFDVICLLFFLRTSGITWKRIHLCNDYQYTLFRRIMMVYDTTAGMIKCVELEIENISVIVYDVTDDNVLKIFHPDKISFENVHCRFEGSETLLARMLLKMPEIKKMSFLIDPDGDENSNHCALEQSLETSSTLEELIIGIPASGDSTLFTTIIDGVIKNKSIKSLTLGFLNIMNDIHYPIDCEEVIRCFKLLLKNNTTLEEIEFIDPRICGTITEINAPLRSLKCSWLKLTEFESVIATCKHLQSLTIDVDYLQEIPITNPFTNLLNCLGKLDVELESLDVSLWNDLFTMLKTNQMLKELSVSLYAPALEPPTVLFESFESLLISNKSLKYLEIRDLLLQKIVPELQKLCEGLLHNETIECLSLTVHGTDEEVIELVNVVFKMKSLSSLTLSRRIPSEQITVAGSHLLSIIANLLPSSSIKELYLEVVDDIIGNVYPYSEKQYLDLFHTFFKTIYTHPTLECVYVRVHMGSSQCKTVKFLAKECLYEEQLSYSQTRVPPLITVH